MPIITQGEYIQMAGRAGRRGLDETGQYTCDIIAFFCVCAYIYDAFFPRYYNLFESVFE